MPTSIRLALATALLIAAATPALSADKRLDAKHLAPAPAADAGTGVADLETWIAPANTAATYRNMEEIFPTRRIASGAWVSPLNAPTAPFDVRYTAGGEPHDIAGFVARTGTTGLLILKSDRIIFEGYYQGADASDLFTSFSTGKSFVSTLV
jgi:hypothetical protein